jgi:hypothetical protein
MRMLLTLAYSSLPHGRLHGPLKVIFCNSICLGVSLSMRGRSLPWQFREHLATGPMYLPSSVKSSGSYDTVLTAFPPSTVGRMLWCSLQQSNPYCCNDMRIGVCRHRFQCGYRLVCRTMYDAISGCWRHCFSLAEINSIDCIVGTVLQRIRKEKKSSGSQLPQ